MLYLREMNAADARAEYECCQDLPAANGFNTGCYGVSFDTFQQELLPKYTNMAKGIGLREGLVPQSYYFLWDDDRPVGLFKLRTHMNEVLRNGAGHIGYGICQSCRGQGYATRGLAMLLDLARDLIPESEAYLSVHKDNPASLKVMLKNGGYIHHEDEKEYYVRIPLDKKENA